MLSTQQPTADEIDRFTANLADRPLSYEPGLLERVDEVDTLPGQFPHGWFIDRHEARIGSGRADFDAACDAFRSWQQFRDDWLAVGARDAPIQEGAEVGYAARVLGIWWVYGCRILEVIDESNRFGFIYGTVGGHAERGEERFLVELDDSDNVIYSLFAMSRPGRWFSWPGLPVARRAQAKFRQRSSATMAAAVRRAGA